MRKTAIALSGGAAHGDFEVGVVQYLYNRKNVKPDILCGTSVGAIAAVKLAEGEPSDGPAKPDKDGHLQGLAGLQAIWKSLRVDSDMYTERDLFSKIETDAKSLLYAGAGTVIGGMTFGPLGLLFGVLGSSSDVQPIVNDILKLLQTRSLDTLDPLATLMKQPSSFNRDQVRASKITLRLAAVALEDGLLRYVTETGDQIERDGTPTLSAPQYDPACAAPIQKQIAEVEGQIKDLQDELNPSDSSEQNDGTAHKSEGPAPKGGGLANRILALYQKRNQLNEQLAKCPKKQAPVNVGLLEAALASSSLPFIFPPQILGDYWYVDGGVRMTTPIEAAVNAGADKIYAVVCSQDKPMPGQSVLGHFDLSSYAPPANLLDIGLRAAADIMPGEINDDQLYPPQGWSKEVIIIRSEHDIHDSFTIDPGLIRIRIAHGFMRADDTLDAYEKDPKNYRKATSQNARERCSTEIIKLRKKIWVREFAANGLEYRTNKTGKPLSPKKLPGGNDPRALEDVRYWKRELKDFVDARTRNGGAVPDDVSDWWNDWEAHSFATPNPLWDAQHPFIPLKALSATADPASLPANQPVTFTVHALDGDNKPVNDAAVMIDGKTVAHSGEPIHYTFKVTVTWSIDPQTHAHIPSFDMPTVTVYKEGYYTARVAIDITNINP